MKSRISLSILTTTLLFSTIAASKIKHIKTVEEFNSVVIQGSENKPVIVDFYSPLCSDCQSFEPVLKNIAEEHYNDITFVKVNTDESEELVNLQNITDIPTVLFVNKKEVLAKEENLKTQNQVQELINKHLSIKSKKRNPNCGAKRAKIVPVITETEFDNIVINKSHNKPVIVKFYGDMCPPCRALAPVIEQLAKEYADHIDFYSVNTARTPDLTRSQKVNSIPTLFFIKDGVVTKVKDARTLVSLKNKIQSIFNIA